MSRVRHVLVEALLWLVSVAGLAAIVLVICAHFFSISLILFRTGSMDPTIPQGSAAVVREIPAEEIAVGDVVTVDRPAAMPVTHRVTSVIPGETDAERVITMQGDANDSEDPHPYTVTEVREVLWSVPGLAQPIHRMGDPWMMGTITVAAALLVGWAFWPRGGASSRNGPDDDADGGDPPDAPHRPRHAGSMGASALLVSTVGLGMAGLSPGAPAQAGMASREQPVVEVVQGEHLRLTSAYRPESSLNLAPGTSALWEVGVSVEAPDPGVVRTGISSSGEFPLHVQVESCAQPWEDAEGLEAPDDAHTSHCESGHQVLRSSGAVGRDDSVEWMMEHSSEQDRWLRLVISLPPGAGPGMQGLVSSLRVHAEAEGEELSTTPPGPDPSPGPSPDPSTPPADDSDAGSDPEAAPEVEQDEGLASTGISVLVLLAAALLSMLLGRMLLRARKNSERRRQLRMDQEVGP
ncbi:S26 family signal peptidase [Nesterenkonia xinjiangensis]|uniref:Signal peptidase n=1 Tax=Nesterenkonia xinjiangensis TaxID=225327 RepID=A0A7Z0K955_9MICC|nr:S26 family signal peptidase [Nesterenkonia xinjiangensis]NYJ78394.1 signal peptidase [Nesterenkonia xinjiangensis]